MKIQGNVTEKETDNISRFKGNPENEVIVHNFKIIVLNMVNDYKKIENFGKIPKNIFKKHQFKF